MKTLKYIPRVSDKLLESLLESTGAVLIEGAKWCGKTQSSLQKANSEDRLHSGGRMVYSLFLLDA